MQGVIQSIRARIHGYAKKLATKYRQITWRYRALPDFIIIGAQKSGTSSLFHYLSQHPSLYPSDIKEAHFFDQRFQSDCDNLGLPTYRAHFPLRSQLANGRKTFEASPSYLFLPWVPARIHQILPGVMMIALLRNPTDRAISHYFHEQRKGREPLPILQAFQAEEERLCPLFASGDYTDPAMTSYSYKSRGIYKPQLARFFALFPRKNLLILSSERFFANPEGTLRKVYAFVGVDTAYRINDLNAKNVGSNRTDVEPEVYEYLTSFFKPHNEELYQYLGEDFGW